MENPGSSSPGGLGERKTVPSLGWLYLLPWSEPFEITTFEILWSFDMWFFPNLPCLPSGHFGQAKSYSKPGSWSASGTGIKMQNFSAVQCNTTKAGTENQGSEEDWQDHLFTSIPLFRSSGKSFWRLELSPFASTYRVYMLKCIRKTAVLLGSSFDFLCGCMCQSCLTVILLYEPVINTSNSIMVTLLNSFRFGVSVNFFWWRLKHN